MTPMLSRLSDKDFHLVANSATPVVITFTAPRRCQDCRLQEPVLHDLAEAGFPIWIVDEEEPDSAAIVAKWGKRGVPFHHVFQNGRILAEELDRVGPPKIKALLASATAR